jgi:hypothetical protein
VIFFLLYKALLYIISYIFIVDELYKILHFINLIHKYFFYDLFLIKYQLILISYENIKLKEKMLNMGDML